jgi:hypothetical protein
MGVKHLLQVFGKLCPLMEDGSSAASGVRSSTHHWPATLNWERRDNKKVMEEIAGPFAGLWL